LIFRHTEEQEEIIKAFDADDRNILVVARPGRGKTTTALHLAEHIIKNEKIDAAQQVLFLTFSRNSVYQIKQAGSKNLEKEIQKRLWIATYHSFIWWLISGFGRFHGLPPKLDVTGKAKARVIRAAAKDLEIAEDQKCFFSAREFYSISYDEFVPLALNLLSKSESLCKAICHRFPIIIIDEFQDTNGEQWELIKVISKRSRLICMADPDQMIYSWRGACEDRLQQLIDECNAKKYPLQQKSMRTVEQHLLDFAESILDDNAGIASIRNGKRFLRNYYGKNALGYYLKSIIREFYTDFKKRDSQERYPTIALAAYSNGMAKVIQEALGKPTAKAPKTYSCGILQGEIDDSLKELIVHLSMWIASKECIELEQSMQLIGGILTSDNLKINDPIASLFSPKKLLDGSIKPRGTTKIILEEFTSNGLRNISSGADAMIEAVNTIKRLRNNVKSIYKAIHDTELSSCQNEFIRLFESQKCTSPLSDLKTLQERLSSERLQRDVLETVVPVRGIISSTLHKLKGREFDYIGIVTVYNDKLRNANDSEKDARRLMYMALTRARYDARVLYIESNPCFLFIPYM
jgi:DNA helicase-2/ATP-dependent DNA helicase PcrA